MTISVERQRFLQEMGEVITDLFTRFSVGEDGVVEGPYGKFIPVEKPAPLDTLLKAMRLAGLDSGEYRFQQYEVIVGNPFHQGRVDLRFPDQLVVKGWRYKGLHQMDLVLRNPFVTAVEIRTALESGAA